MLQICKQGQMLKTGVTALLFHSERNGLQWLQACTPYREQEIL